MLIIGKPLEMIKLKSFNNEHYDDIYRTWYDCFSQNEMFRLFKINAQKTEIIICGVFKITKNNKKLKIEEFDFKRQAWKRSRNLLDLKLFQLNTICSFSSILKQALSLVFSQYVVLDQKDTNIEAWQVKKIFTDTKLKLTQNSSNLAKSLIKYLHCYFINREIYSYCCKIFHEIPTLSQYLYVQKLSLKSLRRIDSENKNLLPIVAYLSPIKIKQSDIFSYSEWVNDKVRNKIFIGSYFEKRDRGLQTFSLKSNWRFFKSLPASVIQKICSTGINEFHIILLSKIKNIKKQPVNIIIFFLKIIRRVRFNGNITNNQYVKSETQRFTVFFNCCLEEILNRKKLLQKRDFCNFMKVLNNSQNHDVSLDASNFVYKINDIVDYLNGNQIFLNKNKTFKALLKDAKNWEREVSEKQNALLKDVKWLPLLGDYTNENFIITEIDNAFVLEQEGREMHHCVITFLDRACENTYRIFSIKHKSGERATLGIKNNLTFWELDQVRGFCNSSVSNEILLIANDIIKLINKK